MKLDGTLHSIFPTPVVVTNYAPTDQMITALDQADLKPEPKHLSDVWGQHTINTQVLRLDECAELRNFILESAKEYANNVLCYKVQDMVDILSWLSVKAPGDNHIPHMHPNSFISCTYYFKDVDKSTPLIFNKPRGVPINTFELAPPFDHEKADKNPYASEKYSIQPKKGDIIFFPSSMYHFVPKNNTKISRYSMAVNMMPVNSVGEDIHLTTFKYLDAHNH
jgi:uncharacterized protein (TIGR02466 family)